jgi:hypothetical protein
MRSSPATVLAFVALLVFAGPAAGVGQRPAGVPAEDARYAAIRKRILANLHWSAHMVRAVDGRTIKSVRPFVTAADIPLLVRMLGDAEARAGFGATGLLACLGDAAVPALEEAARSREVAVSFNAASALAHLVDCRGPDREGFDPELCPPCRSGPP